MMRQLGYGLAVLMTLFLAGCGSKPELVLYTPQEKEVWRTVDRAIIEENNNPQVVLQTSEGTIIVELFEEDAPISTANFLQYVRDGHFEGTIFHRVIPGFMIQGGGLTVEMTEKPTRDPIENEAGNGLRNVRGTLALARTNAVDSASAQFFINLVDNPFLNGDGETGGYAVFGRVYEGMQIVDAIGVVQTGNSGGMSDVPVEPIVIESASILTN